MKLYNGVMVGATGALVLASALLVPVSAQTASAGWSLTAYGGVGSLGESRGELRSGAGAGSGAAVDPDAGGFAGAGLRYGYGGPWESEFAWEYRSNPAETVLDSGERFPDGNYASSAFFINGRYRLPASGTWQPHIGAGIGWLQEVDIDLEANGTERSYSGEGALGVNLIAGLSVPLTANWSLSAEARWTRFEQVDLDAETATVAGQRLNGLEYAPLSLQLGLSYRF